MNLLMYDNMHCIVLYFVFIDILGPTNRLQCNVITVTFTFSGESSSLLLWCSGKAPSSSSLSSLLSPCVTPDLGFNGRSSSSEESSCTFVCFTLTFVFFFLSFWMQNKMQWYNDVHVWNTNNAQKYLFHNYQYHQGLQKIMPYNIYSTRCSLQNFYEKTTDPSQTVF